MQKLFSIYDSKVAAYLPPFTAATEGAAKRMVAASAMDTTHDFSRFGDDFTLFEIGVWNSKEGVFVQLEASLSHGTALSISSSFNS